MESFQCEIAAGEFTADKLRGGHVEISAGAGDVTIEKVDATTMTFRGWCLGKLTLWNMPNSNNYVGGCLHWNTNGFKG